MKVKAGAIVDWLKNDFALGHGHADDLAGMRADPEDLAARTRVGHHQRPDHARESGALLLVVSIVAEHEA